MQRGRAAPAATRQVRRGRKDASRDIGPCPRHAPKTRRLAFTKEQVDAMARRESVDDYGALRWLGPPWLSRLRCLLLCLCHRCVAWSVLLIHHCNLHSCAVVYDPLADQKKKFNREQQRQKKRESEWAGRSRT